MVQYIKHSYGVYTTGDASGTPILLNGPSDVSLNIDQQSILKIVRVGNDLVVYLLDGQQVLIEDFFFSDSNIQQNRLFTSVDGEIQEVALGERYGLFTTAEYRSLESYDNGLLFNGMNNQPRTLEASTTGAGRAGNLGVIAGGIGGVGLLAALAGGGGTNDPGNRATPMTQAESQSATSLDTVDVIAPTAPVIQTASGVRISGIGEPNAIIDVDTNGDGIVDLTTTVLTNGSWSVAPSPALADGTLVTVRQTDPDGNQSVAASDTIDAIAPTAPVVQTASGTLVSGTGEPNAIIDVDTNGDGIVDLTTTVLANGSWSVAPNPALVDGTLVTVRQTDLDGNQSAVASDTIDAIAPTAPVIQTASGTLVSGTGEPNAIIDVDTNGDGIVDLTTTVLANGSWSVAPNPALADGTLVTVRQTDLDGNQSVAASDTVDAIAPATPYVDVSSTGAQITGAAEESSEVIVSYIGAADQTVTLNPITVSGAGGWNTTPNPTLDANEDIYVQTEDADGNKSAHTLVLQGADDGVIDLGNLTGDVAIGVAAFDIESIDLSDNAANALIITDANLQALSTGSDTLRVDGVAGNAVTALGASANGNTVIGGQLYNIFEFASGAQLNIDQDIPVVI